MNDMKKFGKKLFTGVVTGLTAFSMSFGAFLPAVVHAAEECPSVQAGDLIKTTEKSDVYYIDANMKRMPFLNSEVFLSHYEDWTGVMAIPPSCISSFLPSTGVVYRPGSRLFKTEVDAAVYAVLPGNKAYHLADPDVATALYGADWEKSLRTVSDSFTLALNFDASQKLDMSVPHAGQLVKTEGDDVYYVSAEGKLQKVEGDLAAGLAADVETVSQTVFDAAEMDDAANTVTASSLLGNPDTVTTTSGDTDAGDTDGDTDTPAAAGTLTVTLAGNTPAPGYVAKGAYNAEFAKFVFKATGGDVRVDKIVIKRDGLGVDADIDAVRLYDGAMQLGSDQALNTNTHLATFKNLNWDLSSGDEKTLTVKADTNSSPSGTNDYFEISELELEGEGSLTADLPLAGNALQYHSVTMGVLDVNDLTSPGATTVISGATDVQVQCLNFDTNSAEGFDVKSIKLTNNGTIGNSQINKFVLKQGADVLATVDGGFESDGTVTFDMNDSPYYIAKSKSKDLCVYVDIAEGISLTTRTIIMNLAEAKDVVAVGDSSKGQVVITIDDATPFTEQTGQTMTVDQGTLTVAFNTATAPVAADLVDGVAGNKLGAFKFTAGSTEGMKVTRFRLTASGTGVAAADLSNFELFVYDPDTSEETQVGSSQSMSGLNVTFEDTVDGLFDVAAGKNVIVHLYGDVNTAATWTGSTTVAGMNLYVGGTNTNLIVKAKGLKSEKFVAAGDITLSSVNQNDTGVVQFGNSDNGALVISLDNSAPGATSISTGVTDYDFAHYRLYATGEDVNVTQLVVRAYNTSGTGSTASTTGDITNVKLYDITDADNPVQVGTTVASPALGVSTFSFTMTVPKDSYKVLKAVADIPTGSGSDFMHLDVPGAGTVADDISSTGAYSGIDITETGSATGRLMTVATPTITVSWASGATNNVVTNANGVTLGALQLTAGQYENVKVTSIKIEASSSTVASGNFAEGASSADTDLTSFMLVDSEDGTQYGVTKNLTNGTADYATFSGIDNLTVPMGDTKILYVKANVDGSSGTYYVGTAAITNIVAAGKVSGTSATISGTGSGAANAIQSVATLTFATDASNPSERVMAVGASGNSDPETMLVMSVDGLYEDVDITKLVFRMNAATGDSAQNFFADNGLKLYHKVGTGSEKLIDSAPIVSSTAAVLGAYYTATFNITEGDLRVGESDDNLLVLKAKFKGTAGSALTSGTSPSFIFGDSTNANDSLFIEAKGVSSQTALDDAQYNTTSGLNVAGNQIVAYKAYPTFTYVNPGTTLVNGSENNVYRFKVKANGGNVALKQLSFTIDVVDNVGTTNAAATADFGLHTWKLYRISKDGTAENTDLTDNVALITNANASIEGSTNVLATSSANTIYSVWTGTNEEQVPSGSEYTYELRATSVGFSTDADNDYIRVRLANSDTTELTQNDSPYYLTANSDYSDIIELGDSSQANTSTATLVWSDRNANGHSAATGTYAGGTATSTGDWFNGYKIKDTPTNYSQLVR